MGNGASATQIVVDGETLDMVKIKMLIPELRKELKQKDAEIQRCEIEIQDVKHKMVQRNAEVTRLQEEVRKLKSVLQATVHKDGKPDILATIHEDAIMAGQEARLKKQGVSGESSMSPQSSVELKRYEKDFR